jgi:hypothetical protein
LFRKNNDIIYMPLFDLSRRRRGGKERKISIRRKKINSKAVDTFMERWENAYNTKKRKTMKKRKILRRRSRTMRRT